MAKGGHLKITTNQNLRPITKEKEKEKLRKKKKKRPPVKTIMQTGKGRLLKTRQPWVFTMDKESSPFF